MRRILIFSLAILSTTGCSSLKNDEFVELLRKSGSTHPSNNSTEWSAKNIKQTQEMDALLAKQLNDCNESMQDVQSRVTGASKLSFSIATVGIIAGSVIVPTLAAKATASKSALAGWGGISGASNAAQYSLNSNGLSANRIASIYNATRAEIAGQVDQYFKSQNDTDRRKAILNIRLACQFMVLPEYDAPPLAKPAPPQGEPPPQEKQENKPDQNQPGEDNSNAPLPEDPAAKDQKKP